jgi:recombination protein RecA
MSKSSDLKKLLNKSDILTGFIDPDNWLTTGIHSLNFSMTGDFTKGIPNRRSVLFYGPSGVGKSFILSNIAKDAQEQGYTVIFIDTETSVHTKFMEKVGVNTTDEDKFMLINAMTIPDAVTTMSSIFKTYNKEDKICVLLDSLSMLETEAESTNFDKGVQKGSMGQQSKQLKSLVKSVNSKIGSRDMFFIASGHAYENQNLLNGDGLWKFSGGSSVVFVPSISVLMTKTNLKDDDGIVGIKIKTEVKKTRFTKLGGKCEIELDYEKGYAPHAGLLELAVEAGLVDKKGGWYSYTNEENEIIKFQQSKFGDHYLNLFDFNAHSDIVETLEGLDEAE